MVAFVRGYRLFHLIHTLSEINLNYHWNMFEASFICHQYFKGGIVVQLQKGENRVHREDGVL